MTENRTETGFVKVPVGCVVEYAQGDDDAICRAKVFGFIVSFQMRRAGDSGRIMQPRIHDIARGCGLSRVRVYEVLQLLVQEGSLAIGKRRNRYSPGKLGYCNEYHVISGGPAHRQLRGQDGGRYVEVPPRVLRRSDRAVGLYVAEQAQVFGDDVATLSTSTLSKLLRCTDRYVRKLKGSLSHVHTVVTSPYFTMRAGEYFDRRYGIDTLHLSIVSSDISVSRNETRKKKQLRRLHALIRNLDHAGVDGWQQVRKAIAQAREVTGDDAPHVSIVTGLAVAENATALAGTSWMHAASQRVATMLRGVMIDHQYRPFAARATSPPLPAEIGAT